MSTETPSREAGTTPARRRVLWRIAIGAAVVVSVGVVLLTVVTPRVVHTELMRRLRGEDPEQRRRAAWALAARGDAMAFDVIAGQLAAHAEQNVNVREAFLYALSQSGNPVYADILAEIARNDASAYVRQAAWVALSKLDEQRFRVAADEDHPAEAWDQIGLANGYLLHLDTRGVQRLLFWAVAGDKSQRLAASKGLTRGVALLLEAVGRWPLDAPLETGEPWPREFVAEVQRRCAGLDLQAIADASKPHADRIAHVRRNVARLHHTRDRIVHWLFDS